jgi:hypothetical protein
MIITKKPTFYCDYTYDELRIQVDDDSSSERGDGRDILLGPLSASLATCYLVT